MVEDCEIKIGDRSLDSRGDALGDLYEGLERIFGLWKGESGFRTVSMYGRGEFSIEKVVAHGNVFLGCAAFKAVSTGGWITSRVTFEDPVDYGPADKLGTFDTKEPREVSRGFKGELIAGDFSGACMSFFEVQIPSGLLVNVRMVDCAG